MIATLLGARQHIAAASTCTSLITSDAKHLLMCPLAICIQRDPLGRRCLAGLDGNEHPAGWATEGLPSRTPRSSGRKDRGETVMAAPVSEPRSTCPGWGWCRPLSQRTNWGAWVSQGQVARGRPSPLTPGSHWAAAGGRGCPLPTLNHHSDFSER